VIGVSKEQRIMALVLTNVYLEDGQRKILEKMAKKNRSNLSVEVRNAIDVYSTGLNTDELRLLDEATLKAKQDLDEMNAVLDQSLTRSAKFFEEINRLRSAS
jgi:hypothetical protein